MLVILRFIFWNCTSTSTSTSWLHIGWSAGYLNPSSVTCFPSAPTSTSTSRLHIGWSAGYLNPGNVTCFPSAPTSTSTSRLHIGWSAGYLNPGSVTCFPSAPTSTFASRLHIGSCDFDIFLEIQFTSCVLVWPWNPKISLWKSVFEILKMVVYVIWPFIPRKKNSTNP